CGEGVAKRWLEEIGLTPSPEFICHEVDGARIIAPDGTTLLLDETRAGNECGYILERDLFDRFLAREAAKAGADIMIKTSAVALLREDGRVLGARCEHMGETFDVHADVVIGADGFESQVGRWAGLEAHLRTRDIDACLQYTLVGVDGDPRLNDFYLGSCAPGGYAWVFWKDRDVANVGIGVNLSKIRERADAKKYLDRLIERTPGLARGEIVEEVAGAVSVSMPLDRTVAPGVMLAGDAARLIDPLTGGGILSGCLSGRYAGEVAADAIEGGATERQLGRDRVDATIDADRLHALQELDIEERLRCGGYLEERFVEGERVERPLHDSFELWLREEIRLAQDIDERQSVSELDRRVQEDGRNEAARTLDERRIVEIDECGVLAAECVDQDRTGSAEREELNLARGVDEGVVRLKGLQDVRELLGVHRGHVRRGDLRSVRPEALFRHDLLQVHVVPPVEVRRVQQCLRPRLEIHCHAAQAFGPHPQLEQ